MSNKTAMQELIEYLEKYKEVIGMTAVMTIDKAKSLLEMEKNQIILAMEQGYRDCNSMNDFNPQHYYNETFK